jgi:hypothetical protein
MIKHHDFFLHWWSKLKKFDFDQTQKCLYFSVLNHNFVLPLFRLVLTSSNEPWVTLPHWLQATRGWMVILSFKRFISDISIVLRYIDIFRLYCTHTPAPHVFASKFLWIWCLSLTCMWLLLFLGVTKWRYKLWLQCCQELLWGFDGCWNTGSIKGDTKIIIGILKVKTSVILNCSLLIIC